MTEIMDKALAPLDALLVNFAAGRLCPQEELLVSAARQLNPDIRARIAQFEALGAQAMCAAEPAPVEADCLAKVMEKIGEKIGDCAPVKACSPESKSPCPDAPAEIDIPGTVYALITALCASQPQRWRRMTRGVAHMELHLVATAPVQKKLQLMKLAPRQATPRHAHGGTEITLVLQGSFTDTLGTFSRGDVVVLTDPRIVHQPQAGDEGCICLTLTESRLRFRDPFARFMNAFWRA